MARTPSSLSVVEHCWTLVGQRRGRIWYARRIRRAADERLSVRFDGAWVLRREERRHDVLSFLHTHPDGPPCPSRRDVRTMCAWCSAFGKPSKTTLTIPFTGKDLEDA